MAAAGSCSAASPPPRAPWSTWRRRARARPQALHPERLGVHGGGGLVLGRKPSTPSALGIMAAAGSCSAASPPPRAPWGSWRRRARARPQALHREHLGDHGGDGLVLGRKPSTASTLGIMAATGSCLAASPPPRAPWGSWRRRARAWPQALHREHLGDH